MMILYRAHPAKGLAHDCGVFAGAGDRGESSGDQPGGCKGTARGPPSQQAAGAVWSHYLQGVLKSLFSVGNVHSQLVWL